LRVQIRREVRAVKKKAGFWLVLAAAVLLTALVLVNLVLFVPWCFQGALRTANAFLPVRVEVGTYRHVPGDLKLAHVRLSNDLGPICTVRHLSLEYEFLSLFLGRVQARVLEADGVRVHLQRYPDGRFNVSGLPDRRPPDPGPGKPFRPEVLLAWTAFPLAVEKLEIVDGAVLYTDAAAGILAAADGLHLAGTLDTRPLQARLRVEKGDVRFHREGQEGALILGAEGSVLARDKALELSGFQLRPDPGVLELNGSWDLNDNRLSLKADLENVPLDRILSALGVSGLRINGVTGRIETLSEAFREASVVAGLQADMYGHGVRADLKGGMEGGVVRLDSLTVKEAEASLTGKGTLKLASGAVAGNLRLEAPILEKAFRKHDYPDNRVDDLLLEADLGGTLQELEIQAALSLGQWSTGNEPFLNRIRASGSYDRTDGARLKGTADGSPFLPPEPPGELSFSMGFKAGLIHGAVDTGPSMRLKGMFHLEHHLAELSFSARRLHLTKLGRYWVPDLSLASFSGEGRFQGDVRNRESWSGEVKIDELSVSMPELHLIMARNSDLRLGKGSLDLDLSARVNGEPLDLEGTLPIVAGGRMQLRGRASLALAPFQGLLASFLPSLQACKGMLEVQGQVNGTMASPVFRASLDIRDGRVAFASGTAEGTVKGDPQGDIFQGRFRLSADLNGPLKTPEGVLNLQVTDASLYGIPLEEAVLDLAGNGSRWSTDQVQLKSAYGSISLEDGWWDPATDGISARVSSSQWDLGQVLASREIPVDGQARLQGTIQGKLKDPRVNLSIPVKELTVEGRTYGDVDGELDYGEGQLGTRWHLTYGTLEGTLQLKGTRRAAVRASLRDFPLGPIMEAWQGQGWKGRVSLDGNLEGPFADLSQWNGRVALSRLDLAMADVSVRLADPVRLSFTPGEVIVPEAELLFRESSLRLQGTLGRENRFSARGTMELAPFVGLLPWMKLENGTARLDMAVAGTIHDPELQGTVQVDARDLSFPSFPFPVQHLTADLEASAGILEVKSLHASVGEGSLDARGKVVLHPFNVNGMDLKLTSLPVSISDSLSGVAQGTLTFQGNEDSSLFKGFVRIMQARYEQDFDLLGTVLSPRRPGLRVKRVPSAFLKNMRLDIRVRSGPDLYVRNNIARMILSMDVNVRGTASAVAPAGRIRVVQGDVYFNNQDFEITRGTLVFLGSPGTYPTLQLESKTNVEGKYRNYLIYLSMDGPLDRIELTLSSIPALSKEDILFVLFTGMTQEKYFATPTDMKGAGAGLAASGLSALVGKDVKTWTGVDTFELGGYDREGVGIKATLGKRFGERMEIKGTVSVGEQLNRGEAQVEYQLADGFYLVGTQRTDGSFGVDIRFRFVGR